MLCDFCGENEANVYLIKIFKDKVERINICSECAEEVSMDTEDGILDGIAKLLNKLLKGKEKNSKFSGGKNSKIEGNRKCYNCGIDIKTIEETGKVGCKECYKEFSDILMPLIKSIHGSIEYRGKIPINSNKKLKVEKKINDLKSRLNEEIIIENFEEAAKIRDTIKKLKKNYI